MSSLIMPGPSPQVRPRAIALVGRAGSGKDTVANIILEYLPGEKVLLAGPMKEFVGEVFLFDETQLYGSSDARNVFDARYSYDDLNRDAWLEKMSFRYDGAMGVVNRVLDWIVPSRILPPPRKYSLEQIDRARASVWTRYAFFEDEFLRDVVPEGPIDDARILLRRVMQRILDERNISPRLVLQLIGTEFGRTLDIDTWARLAADKVDALLENQKTAAVTDGRFVSEIIKLRARGVEIWRLQRKTEEEGAVEKAGVQGHVSEKEIFSSGMDPLVDWDINNNCSLEELRAMVLAKLSDD